MSVGVLELRGLLIVENLRTGDVRKAEGVFTRNAAKTILAFVHAMTQSPPTLTLRDVMGNNVPFKPSLRENITTSSYHVTNYFTEVSNVGLCNIERGIYAVITTSNWTPSPNDIAPPTVDEALALNNYVIQENPNNTVVNISGSKVLVNPLTARGVGIVAAIFPYRVGTSQVCESISVMLDGFSITEIEYAAGDTIAVTYRLTLG